MLSAHSFGAPASNPLVEAARKALLNNGESAVTSTGTVAPTNDAEQVQDAIDKNAKVSKLEEHPFGASNPLVDAARKALLNNGESAVTSTGTVAPTNDAEQVQDAIDKNAKVSKLEEHPFGI